MNETSWNDTKRSAFQSTHTHTNNIGTFLYDEDESIIVKWKAMTSIGRHFRLDHKLKNTTTLLLMETDWQTVPSWPGSHQNWIDHNRLDRSIWSTTTDGLEWNHNNGERERERTRWKHGERFLVCSMSSFTTTTTTTTTTAQYNIRSSSMDRRLHSTFSFFPPLLLEHWKVSHKYTKSLRNGYEDP